MEDIVGRLLRELPDTDKDRYDIAFARGRAQARSSLVFSGLAIEAIFIAALSILLFRGLLRPEVRTYLSEV